MLGLYVIGDISFNFRSEKAHLALPSTILQSHHFGLDKVVEFWKLMFI